MPKTAKILRKAKGPRKSIFPAHLATTPEAWRALKRQEWLEVKQALDRFQYGSAYVPGGTPLYKIYKLALQIQEAMDQKDWVAW